MARISLAYPKIPGSAHAPADQCLAFEKYDGTNIHWVWDRELGWYAFGMRRNRYDLDDDGIAEFNRLHPDYPEAVALFRQDFASPLELVFQSDEFAGFSEAVVFTEYLGATSFAGRHRESDEKRLVLFDVQTTDGIMPPAEFVETFASLPIARVIYKGRLSGRFITDVREGRYDVEEGVVCKGGQSQDDLWMVKIKTNAYQQRLKAAFAGDWESYWE